VEQYGEDWLEEFAPDELPVGLARGHRGSVLLVPTTFADEQRTDDVTDEA
jgi:hypothetical protein